jgi:hypothetical protein
MEEALWYIRQRSRALQEFRDSVALLWDDTAASELNLRYLNPHQEDAEQLVGQLTEQHGLLESTKQRVQLTFDLALQAEKHSLECAESLEQCEKERRNSEEYYELFREFQSNSQQRFPQIDGLIDKANQSCNGVATQ